MRALRPAFALLAVAACAGGSGTDVVDASASGDAAVADLDADTDAPVPVAVSYGHLQFPCTLTLSGGETADVFVWLYQPGVTEGAGAGQGLVAEVGVGPDNSDPATTPTWEWTAGSYNEDKDGLSPGDLANDEYVAVLTAPQSAGEFDYAFRATADNGVSYLYIDGGGDSCGGEGTTDGYSPANAGQLTIN